VAVSYMGTAFFAWVSKNCEALQAPFAEDDPAGVPPAVEAIFDLDVDLDLDFDQRYSVPQWQ
jgi:hypothetical protein